MRLPFHERALSEALGAGRFSMLGWSFVALCVLDAFVGIWLWQGPRRGAGSGW
jgi:hypothetical protein